MPTDQEKKENLTPARCELCDEFSSNWENSFHRIYNGNPESRTLIRTDEFVVIPTLGQIVEGYLLITPTKHLTTLADISNKSLDELRVVCGSVRAVLEREYGSCVFFEHGARCEGAGGCGIYHAHLHAVPFPAALEPVEFLVSEFPHSKLVDFNEMRKESTGLASYLFYQDSLGRSYMFRTGALPSQYMRKLLAARLGNPDWDWRSVGKEERLLATLARLSPPFENFSALSELRDAAYR